MKRKALSLLLVLTMALSCCAALTGCGGGSDKAKELVGTWQADMDMSDMFNEQFASDPDLAKHVKIDSFVMRLVFTFNDDGTYAFSVDNDSIADSMENVKEALRTGLDSYFTEMMAQQGIEGVDMDTALATMGIDIDAMIDELLSEEAIDEMMADTTQEGKYMVKDGKFYVSDDVDTAADDTCESFTYTLSGSEMSVTEASGADDDMAEFFPLVFKKQ